MTIDKIPDCTHNEWIRVIRICLAELLGLGVIVFVITFYNGQSVPVPIVVGLTFTWVVWVIGPISGAQVNPVVTIVLILTRRLSIVHAVMCMLGQFIGSLCGAGMARLIGPSFLYANSTMGMTLRNPSLNIGQTLGLEIIATCMLVLSILSMTDEFRPKSWKKSHMTLFPFAFGSTLALLACLIGESTGASMNPFRSIGPAIINNNFTEQWIYFVGPIIGGLLALMIYELILSPGASIRRIRACLCDPDFDRDYDYTVGDRNNTEYF